MWTAATRKNYSRKTARYQSDVSGAFLHGADLAPHALFYDHTHRLHPGAVAIGANATARARPTPVAIHDDGHVAGQRDGYGAW